MAAWKVPNHGKQFCSDPIPARAGIGLRGPHYKEVANAKPNVGFFEVHSENFFGQGGVPHYYLERVRRDYALSFHGVGLSLGSTDSLNTEHLKRLQQLVETYQPEFISEHLSWGSVDDRYLNDLLPLPYTDEAVQHLAKRINQTQDYLQRSIMVENVSCYLQFNHSHLSEWEFVSAVAELAHCRILLDINNIYVNAHNHGFDAINFLQGISGDLVQEIHLAGHTVNEYEQGKIIIDTHDHRVCDDVWELFAQAILRYGPKPTLIEWDSNLPKLQVLLDEADIAQNILAGNNRARVA